jgi:hypothetical protein
VPALDPTYLTAATDAGKQAPGAGEQECHGESNQGR